MGTLKQHVIKEIVRSQNELPLTSLKAGLHPKMMLNV